MKNLHGEWELSLLKPDIMLLRSWGPWNIEAGVVCLEEMKQIVTSLGGKPWIILGDFRRWEFSVPEMKEFAKGVIVWNEEHHCRGGVYLVNTAMQLAEVVRHIPSEQRIAYPRLTCNTIAEMHQLVCELGFALDYDELESALNAPPK